MTLSKEAKYEYDNSRGSQFEVWKVSKIAESKKLTLESLEIRQKPPNRLADVDMLLDEITFGTSSLPRKMRSLHLSLKQTKILATLLPNEIINISDISKDSIDTFVGVLLFADVSGFTALCERYNGFGKSASDKLTATLNNYLGAMVEVIYKYGGDVLKFSGDAILALWKLENNEYMYSLIHRVICCALFIQNSIGVYETDVKILLKVKLAISAGNMTFSVIGDDNSRHYLIVGSPVYEVKSAEKVCTSGEVVLSFSAWGHLSPVNYEHYWKDEEHVKIIRIIYNPENTKRQILRAEVNDSTQKFEIRHLRRSSREGFRRKLGISSSAIEVRALVEDAAKRDLSSELRTFLIPSVIQQIDADLPMEYLSEMRNVTVMFINIIPNRLHTRRLINLVDKAYIIICSFVYKAMGSVNKVSLFDKDVMVLAIFGLRGFNHEGEVAASLKCGYDIRQACCALDGVASVSVGITTGQAYCGVVGHPLRREYTVIGAVVNKAARIMCAYPGKVTCDRDTFLFSNLAASFFAIQEKRHLKGIEDTGPIYEFTREKGKNTLAAMHSGMYPILGREEEIQTFHNILKSVSNHKSQEKAILVRGPDRIGKTRLLDEMIVEAHKKGFLPIMVALHTVHSTLAYGTAQCIIKQILDIPDSATVDEKEQRLIHVLKNQVPVTDYWYLNEVMNVRFPKYFEEKAFVDPVWKFEKIKKLFHIILATGTKSILFAIDDIDFCDELSWKLLMSVIDNRIKFLIMTMPKRLRPGTAKFIKFPPETDAHILKLTLSGLSDDLMPALACQILNAKAVPGDVVRILTERSNGNPGWCESFLVSLCQSNVLKVEELPVWYIKSLELIIPSESYLKRKQYAVIPDHQFRKSDINDAEEKNVSQEDISSEKEPYSSEKIRFFGKIKNVTFSKEKSTSNLKMVIQRRRTNEVQIEEAYEDLRQRIQLVRSQSKIADASNVIPAPDLIEEEPGEEEEGVGETQFSKDEYPKSDSDLSDSIKDENLEKRSSSPKYFDTLNEPTDDAISLGAISSTSLKDKIQEIHRRISLRRYSPAAENFRLSTDSDIVIRSVTDLRDEKDDPDVSKSKSAENLVNRVGKVGDEAEAQNPKGLLPTYRGNNELLPSDLWKSHTQNVIDESIRLFIEKKAKSERGKTGRKISKMPATSESSQSGPSFRSHSPKSSQHDDNTGKSSQKGFALESSHKTYKLEKAIQTIKKFPKRSESMKSIKERFNYNDKMSGPLPVADALTKSDGEHSSADSNKSLGKDKKPFSFQGRALSAMKQSKQQGGRRSWALKLFDRMKKHSVKVDLSDSDLDIPTEMEDGNDIMPAILVSPSIKLDEVATPECFAGIIMSAFDCLRPYEQLMLKCGSILGEKFSRKMLNATMHNPNPVLTAEAVKRLFEMRILCCGSEAGELEFDRTQDCYCICHINDTDIIDDTLPRYSYCRILLFKYTMFRSTLYELIPLDQKREFHIRAVEFLEKEKMYCSSCEALLKSERRLSKMMLTLANARPTSEDRLQRENSFLSQNSQRMVSLIDASELISRRKKINKKTELSPLALPSVLPSFQKCECVLLRADSLKQLINHCIAAGLQKKEIEFIIDYSSIMINLGEFGKAGKLLGELEIRIKTVEKNVLSKREKRLFMGRIHMLQGQLNLELGALKKANICLLTALKYFGSSFKPLYIFRPMQYLYEYTSQLFHQNYSRITRKPKTAGFTDRIAACLSLLSNVFMLQGRWELARVVALRSLNYLRKNNNNLIELCNSYSNLIDIYRHFGDFKFCRKLEVDAERCCSKLISYRTIMEVIAVGRLNCSVFNARFISGYLFAATKLGVTAVKIGQCVSSHNIESYIISQVVQIMLMIGKLNKAAGLILILPVQDIWHYILSLEFTLETGFVIESCDLCVEAIRNILSSGRIIETEVQIRAVSVVYVWMARLRRHEEAEVWYRKLPHNPIIPQSGDTLNKMITILKILEGCLITLASPNTHDFGINILNKKVTGILKALQKSTKSTEIMLPRFHHLHAYYQYRINNLPKALLILSEARRISIDHGNVLERSWISHSKKVWTGTCDFDKNFWTTSAEKGKLMKWTDGNDLLSWKNYMFSLDIPQEL